MSTKAITYNNDFLESEILGFSNENIGDLFLSTDTNKFFIINKLGNAIPYNIPTQQNIFLEKISLNLLSINSINNNIKIYGRGFSKETIFKSNTINISISNINILSDIEAEITITTNNNAGTYLISALNNNSSSFNDLQIEVLNANIYTPKLVGLQPELWVKPNTTNNNCILQDGVFEAQNDGGNGWNEHAYFGSFTSVSKIIFNYEVERLSSNSNAYCFINLSTTNTQTTGGVNPKIYHYQGNNLRFYKANGSYITTNCNVGDIINIELTPTSMIVKLNDIVVLTDNYTYNLNNIFMNFVGYRIFKAKNIRVIEF